jgi:hypothetical protein
VGAREAEYADVEYGCLGALHLHAGRDPLMRKILQYHMREICCKQQAQAALQQRRALAAGSELWPVRTVLTKKQPVAPNGSAQ